VRRTTPHLGAVIDFFGGEGEMRGSEVLLRKVGLMHSNTIIIYRLLKNY